MDEENKNKGNNLTLIQLNNYVKPKIVEERGKNFVTNGKHNSYFHYVNDRYIGSPTNSAINNGYVSWIYGKGLASKDQADKPNQYARLYSMLKKKDIKRIVTDYQIQGMAYMQIIRNRDNTISSITHVAVDKIAPEIANEDNVIEAYYYSNDFKNRQIDPQRIPAFSVNNRPQPIEIYAVRPYQLGMEYFALPTYQSGLQYSELEEEISNYSISHMKNGLSFGYIINIPDSYNLDDDQKREIEKKIKNKLTGSSRAGTFMINFANGENAIEVTALEINDAHQQWQFLSDESQDKILVSHECVSPMLFGIKDSSGFSSNADELAESERQTIERVIQPKQDAITDAFEEVLSTDDINLDLFFKPLSERVEVVEKTQLSADKKFDGATSEMANTLIELGENDSEKWELLCSSEVEYDTDSDLHGYLSLSTSTGVARPNAKSEQDSEDIKIRYRYVDSRGRNGKQFADSKSREFCFKMMLADKLYRKEDILQMERAGINDGFGLGGTNSYSIWLWKGGGRISEKYPNGTCKHKWQREIYLKVNGNVDVNSPLAKQITTSEARRKGYRVPTNNSNVSITPHNNK
jgi:hypothetical protein